MSCDDCLASAIRARLGRCPVCAGQTFIIGPVCAGQTFIIGLVGWLAWWWCGADASIPALTGLLFALAGSGLFALHLSAFLWRQLAGVRDNE